MENLTVQENVPQTLQIAVLIPSALILWPLALCIHTETLLQRSLA